MLIPHPVSAASFNILPVSFRRVKVRLVIRRNSVQLSQRFRFELHRPCGEALIHSGPQPLVDILLCILQGGALRMLLLDVSQKIFDVLPVVFIGGVRKYFILRRAVGHCLFFALAECQHPCQLVIGLLMQILGICFVSASHSGLLSVYFLNLFFTLQSSSARLFRLLKPGAASCQLHLESRQSAIHFFYLLMCAVYRNRSPTLF